MSWRRGTWCGALAFMLPALGSIAPPPRAACALWPARPVPRGLCGRSRPLRGDLCVDDGISLMTPDYLINLSLEQPDPYREQTAKRRVRPTRASDKSSAINRRRRRPAHRESASSDEGKRAVIVRSSVAEEQTALTRVIRADRGASMWTFAAPDFRRASGCAFVGAPIMPGPFIAAKGGSAMRRAAKGCESRGLPGLTNTPSRVVLPGAHLAVQGPTERRPASWGRSPPATE